MSKQTITVKSPAGVHVPGMGRLGKGVHKDIELNAEQLAAVKTDPDAEIATKTKQAQEA
ncbi:hypothetical protein [Mariprofundus ferrooxydans]|uniref:hypothetical protein n=1 Tax=Mariprofundus ferrooxydans TaxID=314344 RepID=UPI00143194D7|nr:hypothetical protein [Mariprofundus ferrooxydans]